jgi:hypothetical protein
MRKKSIVISAIGCACLAIAAIIYGATPRAHVSVKKKLEISLRELPTAFVDVRAVVDERTISTSGDVFIESVIDEILRDAGTRWTFDDKEAEILVKCRYRSGWGLPYLGRHLDSIHWSSPNWVDVAVIDRKNGSVLGEVEYRRPLFATRAPSDLINRMFAAMAVKVHVPPLTPATPAANASNARPEERK